MSAWQDIKTAKTGEVIVAAYFGPEDNLFGQKSVGHFFQWDNMPNRIFTGNLHRPPTHWTPLPEDLPSPKTSEQL